VIPIGVPVTARNVAREPVDSRRMPLMMMVRMLPGYCNLCADLQANTRLRACSEHTCSGYSTRGSTQNDIQHMECMFEAFADRA